MQQEIKAVIVDDEANGRENLSFLLNEFFPMIKVVGMAESVDEAEKLILNELPQLVFLDISLGNENVFTLLEKLPKLEHEIIFVTAHEGHMRKAFDFMALGYLVKPIDTTAFIKKVNQAVSRIGTMGHNVSLEQMMMQVENFNRSKHKIALSTAKGYELVYINDIMYCEADGSYTHFHFKEGPELVVSKNLKYYENLMVDYGFIRSHNTVLVNLRYIKTIERSSGGGIIMEDGKTLAVSKTRRQELEQRIKEQRRLV